MFSEVKERLSVQANSRRASRRASKPGNSGRPRNFCEKTLSGKELLCQLFAGIYLSLMVLAQLFMRASRAAHSQKKEE